MKKFILSIFLVFASLFFLPQQINSQELDCRKIFNQDLKKCSSDSNSCQAACSEKTKKPDGTIYFNSGEIYTKCTRESQCHEKRSACGDQALADLRACGKPDEQPKTAEVKNGTPIQDGIRFLGEWTPQVISDWTTESDIIIDCRPVPVKACLRINVPARIPVEFKTVTGKNLEEILNWQPIITKEVEQKAWEEFLPIYTPGKENITIVAGEGEIKGPASPRFFSIIPNENALTYTYLDSTVRATSDAIQLRYTWSADSGAVINVPKWSEIKFQEPVEVKGFTSHTVELGQGEIEVRVRNNKPAENQFGVDAGWLGVTVSRTHFWVSQSEDKKIAVIGVYEGEVEVKTRDGKTVKVAPDGDKPGVVVISQKLSVIKLTLIGLVLAAVIGSITMILRKKLGSRGFSKKKK